MRLGMPILRCKDSSPVSYAHQAGRGKSAPHPCSPPKKENAMTDRSRGCPAVIAGALATLLGVGGCGPRNAYVPPPLPEVEVAVPVEQTVTVYDDFTGVTHASETVEVRSRVQGYLESIHFADGADVRRGDLLFVIDRKPYQAQMDQAKADLESKKAAAARAEALYRRTSSLLPSKAATREDLDKARGDWEVAKADVGQAEAKVRQAQLNLDYCQIHAPIGGFIGRRLVDVGNLVQADTTLLTTITRYDPMYVYFTMSESDLLQFMKRYRERPAGSLEARGLLPTPAAVAAVGLPASSPWSGWLAVAVVIAATPGYPVELGLGNEGGKYPHKGYIDFAENTVDPGTGTLQLRGTFSNPPPYILGPGMFARLRVPIGVQEHALLVPKRALAADQQGDYLLVLGPDDTVERRAVELGAEVGGQRVVEKGLSPGERFIVEGLQQARPHSKVRPMMTAEAGRKEQESRAAF
jgi:RND family efflux transporter MFP subunit